MTASPGGPLSAAAPHGGALVAPKGRGSGRRGSRRQLGARIAILVLVFGYLILPLFAMLEFSTRGNYGSRTPGLIRRDPQQPEPDRRRHHVARRSRC